MDSIIGKKEEYLQKINEIVNGVEARINEYKLFLENEAIKKVKLLRDELEKESMVEIEKYETKIRLLDEIIAEEMPEAKLLTDMLENKEELKKEIEVLKEEFVRQEEPKAIEEVEQKEPEIQEAIMKAEEKMEELNQEPITEEVVEEVVQPIEEEKIDDVEIVEENIVKEIIQEPVQQIVTERPGMNQIICPTRE